MRHKLCRIYVLNCVTIDLKLDKFVFVVYVFCRKNYTACHGGVTQMTDACDKFKSRAAVTNDTVWVQTERAAHEAWGKLCVQDNKASAMLHYLCALVDKYNSGVIVISTKNLAKIMGCSPRTVERASATLQDGNWVQRIHVSGTTYGYAINTAVAWVGLSAAKFDGAAFHAAIIVDREESGIDKPVSLRRVPLLFPPGEKALPVETGGESGSQLQIPGTETSIRLKREQKDFTQVALPLPCPSCGGASQPDSEGTGASVCTACGLVF